MQAAGAADRIELLAQPGHPVTDQAPVSLDLGFARPAEKTKAAALTFKVGPAANQPPGLIVQMRELNLQASFCGRRAFAEYLKDQPGPVDHFALELFLKIALLDRGERAIDNHQLGIILIAGNVDVLDLAFAKQRSGPRLADRDRDGIDHVQPDRQGEAARLFEPRRRVDRGGGAGPEFRVYDQRPRTAGHIFAIVIEKTQSLSPSASSSQPSPVRSTGVTG